jgi:hypothetical protein
MEIFNKLPSELCLIITNYLYDSEMKYSKFRSLPSEIHNFMFDFDVRCPLLLGIAIENNDFEYVDKHIPNYDYIKLKKLYCKYENPISIGFFINPQDIENFKNKQVRLNKFLQIIMNLAHNINMKIFIYNKYKKIIPFIEKSYVFENQILSYVLQNYNSKFFLKLNQFMNINKITI